MTGSSKELSVQFLPVGGLSCCVFHSCRHPNIPTGHQKVMGFLVRSHLLASRNSRLNERSVQFASLV